MSVPGWVAPAPVTVLVRPGCHLCDVVRPVAQRAAADHGLEYAEVVVDDDPRLVAAYGEMIPVTLLDCAVIDYWRLDEARLRAALAAR